jgi:hypothetical protein
MAIILIYLYVKDLSYEERGKEPRACYTPLPLSPH